MSLRKIHFTEDEYYHLYNRGNNKQKIFRDKADYARFMGLLFACNSPHGFKIDTLSKKRSPYDFDRGDQIVHIGAYCLMPNHFHILITQAADGGISKFMQKLTTAYVMYYNKKYERSGGLFESKFKSEHADTDTYLKYLFSYIHLNPVKLIKPKWREEGIQDKKAAFKYLTEYPHSSCAEYLKMQRQEKMILNKESFPDYFPDEHHFQKELFDWISYR